MMKPIDKTIKGLEPLMHGILKRYGITKQYYQDYLQELRIVAWKVLQEYDKNRGALSTVVSVAMRNRLKNLLRDNKNNCIYLEDLSFYKRNKALGTKTMVKRKIDLGTIKNGLSDFESKIFELYLNGVTQSKIAQLLGVSRSKVQRQIKKIFSKIRKITK